MGLVPLTLCDILAQYFVPSRLAPPSEPAVARKSRQIGLCKYFNGNKKFGLLRKLSCSPGVLPRPIETTPRGRTRPPRGGIGSIPHISPKGRQKRPIFAPFRGACVFVRGVPMRDKPRISRFRLFATMCVLWNGGQNNHSHRDASFKYTGEEKQGYREKKKKEWIKGNNILHIKYILIYNNL